MSGGGDFLCHLAYAAWTLRTSQSAYTPILHSDGRSGRQRLPTVGSRYVV